MGHVVPPSRTWVFAPLYAPKPEPVSVNETPMGPDDGTTLATAGATTVKYDVALDSTPFPDERSIHNGCGPGGKEDTLAVIVASFQTEIASVVPPSSTRVSEPADAPKPGPVMVNEVPTGPDEGDGPAKLSAVTVKVPTLVVSEPEPWTNWTVTG
jgi:hypothetical protein